jgi:hypothetical protein
MKINQIINKYNTNTIQYNINRIRINDNDNHKNKLACRGRL